MFLSFYPLRLLGYLLVLVLTLAFQQVLVTYVHSYAMFSDIILCIIILYLFNLDIVYTKWLFIIAFTIGIIQAVWLSQRLGIASTYYLLLTIPYKMFKNILGGNIQLLLCVSLALIIKFLLYGILGYIFRDEMIIGFIFGREFLYQCAATLLLTLVVFFPLNSILSVKRR